MRFSGEISSSNTVSLTEKIGVGKNTSVLQGEHVVGSPRKWTTKGSFVRCGNICHRHCAHSASVGITVWWSYHAQKCQKNIHSHQYTQLKSPDRHLEGIDSCDSWANAMAHLYWHHLPTALVDPVWGSPGSIKNPFNDRPKIIPWPQAAWGDCCPGRLINLKPSSAKMHGYDKK